MEKTSDQRTVSATIDAAAAELGAADRTANSTTPPISGQIDREKLAQAILAQANALTAAAAELSRRDREGARAMQATLLPTTEVLARYDRALAKIQVLVCAPGAKPKQ